MNDQNSGALGYKRFVAHDGAYVVCDTDAAETRYVHRKFRTEQFVRNLRVHKTLHVQTGIVREAFSGTTWGARFSALDTRGYSDEAEVVFEVGANPGEATLQLYQQAGHEYLAAQLTISLSSEAYSVLATELISTLKAAQPDSHSVAYLKLRFLDGTFWQEQQHAYAEGLGDSWYLVSPWQVQSDSGETTYPNPRMWKLQLSTLEIWPYGNSPVSRGDAQRNARQIELVGPVLVKNVSEAEHSLEETFRATNGWLAAIHDAQRNLSAPLWLIAVLLIGLLTAGLLHRL